MAEMGSNEFAWQDREKCEGLKTMASQSNKGEDPVVMPQHYKVLADELKGLVRVIDDAFINRPVPDGSPCPDIHKAIEPILKDFVGNLTRISEILNFLPGCVADKAAGPDESAEIRDAASNLKQELSSVIFCFHAIWRSPFPVGFADGQAIASAVVEDILRECRNLFLKVVDIVEMPPEDIVGKYGSTNIQLSLTFSDQPGRRLKRWLDDKSAASRAEKKCVADIRRVRDRSLLWGLLLGWWWGRRD